MPRVLRRETLIALRATRTAYQVSSEILNPHVEVTAVPCRNCGGDVPLSPDHLELTARCPACGAEVMLPANSTADVSETAERFDVPDGVRYDVAPPPHLTAVRCIAIALLIAIVFAGIVSFVLAIIE